MFSSLWRPSFMIDDHWPSVRWVLPANSLVLLWASVPSPHHCLCFCLYPSAPHHRQGERPHSHRAAMVTSSCTYATGSHSQQSSAPGSAHLTETETELPSLCHRFPASLLRRPVETAPVRHNLCFLCTCPDWNSPTRFYAGPLNKMSATPMPEIEFLWFS